MYISLRRVVRALHSSHYHLTVTRKPYSELPSRLKQPDNASVAPGTANAPPTTQARPRRGRKPKSALPTAPLSPKQPRNSLATEILTNHSMFPHCILLTRVGQFYESYFGQANEVARLLGIKLTSRVWDKQDVPMCGFPIMHLDKYIKILVQQHKRFVAMSEEFPRYTIGQKPEIVRRVVRVITPGTLIDESFLNHFENNYLLAIFADPLGGEQSVREIGLAWIDVSTGEFFTRRIPFDMLKDDLARISPREIVLTHDLREQPSDPVRLLLDDEASFLVYAEPSAAAGNILPQSDSTYTLQELAAINLLTTYMQTTLMEHMPQLPVPNREATDECMQIDSHTIKALEIRESAREGGLAGSLLSVIKRTITHSGARFLSRRLCSPSTSIREIEARQSLVALFYQRPDLRDDIARLLQTTEDIYRIIQLFLSSKGESKDLLSLNRTIQVWTAIRKRIELEKEMERRERDGVCSDDWLTIDTLLSRIICVHDLSTRITLALEDMELQTLPSPDEFNGDDIQGSEQKSSTSTYGIYKKTIRPEFSSDLAALHSTLGVLLERRRTLERNLQIQYNTPSLTLRTTPAYGMHVHIGRAKRDQAKIKTDPAFIIISENNSTGSYFYQPWSQLGAQITETTAAIANAEKDIFHSLREEVRSFSSQLRQNARVIDELDVALSLAILAANMRFVRPVIKDDATYEVTSGRHPTVELGLLSSGRTFTPNSVALKPDSRLHIITGPNMAGKSTFLRQTALIAILAQTGSFVPAEHAAVGIVDKLFSRVGAQDDVFRDRSTFMVEMLETAHILRRATAKSLVIMDEVGRGTTVKDGLAIAFATIHHLVVHNRCRALFATHFHELADLLAYDEANHHGGGVFRDVGFYCTDVLETPDTFTYSHSLEPGVNRNSHGLKVAQLAGMPDSALLLAKNTLAALQQQQFMNPKDLSDVGKDLTVVTAAKTDIL